MKRIRAAHATKADHFAISISGLDGEDPRSLILTYNAAHKTTWGFVELPRTIKSITSVTSEFDGKPTYVPLSNEGDVYFLEGDVPEEKIAGAGIQSDDAAGFGAMTFIGLFGDALYAAGYGSQIYKRQAPDKWALVCGNTMKDMPDCIFHALGMSDNGAVLTACGEFRKGKGRNKAENKSIEEDPGAFFVNDGGIWVRVHIFLACRLYACAGLARGVLAVGQNGTIIYASGQHDFKDFSLQVRDDLVSIARDGDRLYVLGDAEVFVLNRKLVLAETIKLPAKFGSPHKVCAFGGVLLVFSDQKVARYTNGMWSEIEVPKKLWDMI